MRSFTALLPLALVSLTALPAQAPAYRAVMEPQGDAALASLPGGVMLALPGLFTDFVIAGGGQFVELPGGTARITARVFSASSLYSAFLVDIELSGRVTPGGAGHPPAGGPDLRLQSNAYAPSGPVDPSTFVYYTQGTGTLTGVRNYDGAVLGLQLTGSGAQLGAGANNRNGSAGLLASFAVTVLRQPAAPLPPVATAELSVDLPPHRADAATHPQVDVLRSTLPFGRAMTLPGVGDDYVFVPAGEFVEFDDGHAELSGTLARVSQLDDAWDVSLTFGSRVDPGQANHPPVGAPVLQMLPSAYVQGGGTVDPAHWHYYENASGTLTGAGINAGGVIALSSNGPLQYGGGANQTDTYFGFYGAFAAGVVTQPAARTVAVTGAAELYGLTAVFPVLPFPVLTTPATPYSLPTLTDQGIVVTGDNLAWAELAGVDWDLVGTGGASRWFSGWFRVIDNQTIEVHPRPGKAPGSYGLSVFNPAIRSNVVALDLTAPTSPVLFGEAAVSTFETLHAHVHQGAISGPAMSGVAMSGSMLPTTIPGVANLGIGNQQTELLLVPGGFLHDPANGIARYDLGPVPPWFSGFTLHFQAVTIDLTAQTLPLAATNVWSVDF